jgi:voltage-gated potassium channel
MEEVVGSLTSRQYSINDSNLDVALEEESHAPLLSKSATSPASTFVSSISSKFTKHAQSFMDGGDEEEDEEDETETFVQNVRKKRTEVAVRLPQSKNIDFNYYKKARKMLRSIRHPNSSKRSWWYLLVTIIAFYNVVSIPLRLGFRRLWSEREALEVLCFFDYFCDVICILDMALNFFSSYMEQGECQWEVKKTAKRYLKTVFVFDLVSTIPMDVVVWSSVWKHMLFRMPRMLRLLKVPGYFSYVERQSAKPYVFTLLKVVAGALAINHIFACGYYGVAYYEGFGKTKFLPGEEMERAGLDEQYLNAFWWATNVITRVGGSPSPPVTTLEKGIMLPIAFFTLFFVAFVIGGVSEALNRLGDNMSRFRRKVDSINAYMNAKNIPPKLKRRVKEYFDQLWARGGGQDDSSILREFPEHLRTQLSVHINGEIVPKVPFFANCSGGFIKAIVSHLKPHIFAPGDWIVREGDAGSDMFFISKGNVSISSASGEALSILGEGDYFGEICLMIDTTRTASVRSLNYCDLFSLNKNDLSHVLQLFPNERPILQSLAEKRIGQDFLRNILCRDPSLLHCSPSFISSLSESFDFQRFFHLQFIYKFGNLIHSDSAFFIATGSIDILNPQGHTISSLSEGEFFGLHSLLQSILLPSSSIQNARRSSSSNNPPLINPSSSLDSHSHTSDLHSVPMTTLPTHDSEATGASPSSSSRNISIRAQSPVCIVFILERMTLEHLLSQPEFKSEANIIKKDLLGQLSKSASLSSQVGHSVEKDTIFHQMDSMRVPLGSSSLDKKGSNRNESARKDGVFPLGSKRNDDSPLDPTDTNEGLGQASDSINASSEPKDSLSRRRHLKKQMSAFLKTPLEAAREIMRAKQRSATLARKLQSDPMMPSDLAIQENQRQENLQGAPAAPSSTAEPITSLASHLPQSGLHQHLSPTSHSFTARSSLESSELETAAEMGLIHTLFGTPNRTAALLTPSEALQLLQVLSSIQSTAVHRASTR